MSEWTRTVELEILFAACAGDAPSSSDVVQAVVDRRDSTSDPVTRTPDRQTTEGLLLAALEHLVKVSGSDLHIKAGRRPYVRVDGCLRPAPLRVATEQDCAAIVAGSMPARHAVDFDRVHDVDYALAVDGLGRFRVNAFHEGGRCALAFRLIAPIVPSASELGLLPVVQRLALCTTGLVLVTGRVGSGKSTTLAWIVDQINESRTANIVTIEDPIEYTHLDKRSIVHQREVGADTASHAEGLRRVLRQDPDVLVIGEIRDEDTARTALTAAQTGHLVLATLHTDTVGEAIDRISELVPAARQHQTRMSLAATLHAVVGQRLVPGARGGRRVLAQEVLISTGRIARRIVHPSEPGPSIADMIADDEHLGMVSFDQHLAHLYRAGVISRVGALEASTNPHDLSLAM